MASKSSKKLLKTTIAKPAMKSSLTSDYSDGQEFRFELSQEEQKVVVFDSTAVAEPFMDTATANLLRKKKPYSK